MQKKTKKEMGARYRSGLLAIIDLLSLFLVFYLILYINPSFLGSISYKTIHFQMILGVSSVFVWRLIFSVYRQIWRFGNIPSFVRLIEADAMATLTYCLLIKFISYRSIRIIQALTITSWDLLLCITYRMVYAFLYQYSSYNSRLGRIARPVINFLTGLKIEPSADSVSGRTRKIRVAIVGAGRVGVMLADELLTNANAPYVPVLFVDIDKEKVGRKLFDIPVVSDADIKKKLEIYTVQEVIFAIPDATTERKQELFEYYKDFGGKIRIYDYPSPDQAENSGGRRSLREFEIDDLLYRTQRQFLNDKTKAFFTDKVVLITGGGGSIGSELCRQIARMKPRKLIVLDVYENNAYDIQQELRIAYGAALDFSVEIFSVTDKVQLEACFEKYRPEVVLHAAAHKHVPLMEHNVCEAVANNVFGTLNVVKTAEKFGVKKFIMISTDKAVNPTNVMGATKRMCEMIVLSHAACDDVDTSFSCTRFGNVLGSNGSVIPLFKRQIAAGGPVTITDKRIIRYFMTIPEASQLVLTSGAMAKNGELFVLDMGKPVKIYDLAVNMIRLSGLKPEKDIAITETGLRPGEKLFEELLIKTEDLDKTDNELIFVERQSALSRSEVEEKLEILRAALATNDNDTVRAALHQVVPTFKTPEEVNALAEKAEEMKMNN